jgi:hypothetical protein
MGAACCSRCEMGLDCANGSCGVKPKASGSCSLKSNVVASGVVSNRQRFAGSLPIPVKLPSLHNGSGMIVASRAPQPLTRTKASGATELLTAEQMIAKETADFNKGLDSAKLAIDTAFRLIGAVDSIANRDSIQKFDLAMKEADERIKSGESTAAIEQAKANALAAQLAADAKSKSMSKDPTDIAEQEKKGLSTPVIVGIAVAGTAVVGFGLWAALRKRRR